MGLLGWAGDQPLDLDFGKADLIFLQSSIVFPLGTCGMRSWVDAKLGLCTPLNQTLTGVTLTDDLLSACGARATR